MTQNTESAERHAKIADGERRAIEQAASSSASSSSPPSQNQLNYYSSMQIETSQVELDHPQNNDSYIYKYFWTDCSAGIYSRNSYGTMFN